jgi:hypothetical protein
MCLDLPAKSRAAPFWNVWIIDPLKVAKACLQDPGKIRTPVAGHGGEQTHCFHDRHIGGGNLGKCILFELGPQQSLPLDDLHQHQRRPPPIVPRIPAARKIKPQSGASRRNLSPSNVALTARAAPRSRRSQEPPNTGEPRLSTYVIDGIIAGVMAIHLFASPRAKPASKRKLAIASTIMLYRMNHMTR